MVTSWRAQPAGGPSPGLGVQGEVRQCFPARRQRWRAALGGFVSNSFRFQWEVPLFAI